MADYPFVIFAAGNLNNPQNPGVLPAEDGTFLSDLVIGDTVTWTGGAESAEITIVDNADAVFDEADSNQTLRDAVTFDGVSYSAGQVVTPTYTINFSGSDGNSYTMTSFNFSPNTNNEVPDAVFWEGAIPPSGTVLTVVSEVNPTQGTARDYTTFATCFCRGTLIETAHGPMPVEALSRGLALPTENGTLQPIEAVLHRHIPANELAAAPNLLPVRISAGALGNGLPTRDLWVSRQHRMLVSSPICQRMFGGPKVLVAAVRLTDLPGVYVDDSVTTVEYFHILMPQHEVIFAENTATESLYLGHGTLGTLSQAARDEITQIFPDLVHAAAPPPSAFPIPPGRLQKKLVARHAKNRKPISAPSRV